MACTNVTLRTDLLTGADTGGSWVLDSGPAGNTIGTLTGDNPSVDFSVEPEGTYTFTYSGGVPPCDGSVSVNYENLNIGDPGTTQTDQYCDSDSTAYNLFALIGATAGSTGDSSYAWSGTGTASAGYTSGDGQTDTFNPQTAGAGSYVFVLTITPTPPAGYSLLPCCAAVQETLTIDVITAFNAGTAQNSAGC